MTRVEIDPRIVKARAALITAHPFFGALALHLQPVTTTSCPRLATDGRHLFYNVEFLDTITSEELKGIIAHEVYHCALKHHTRRSGRDPKEWNQATDFVINPMVLKAGLKLPTWVLLDPQYDGLSAEQVYRIRQQKRQQQEREKQQHQSERTADGKQTDPSDQSSDDEGDQAESKESDNCRDDGGDEPDGADIGEAFGNGERVTPVDDNSDTGGSVGEKSSNGENEEHRDQGDDGINEPSDSNDPNACGEILDAVPATNAGSLVEQEAEWDVRVRQAVNVAAKTAGSVPGFLAPIVEHATDGRCAIRRMHRDRGVTFKW